MSLVLAGLLLLPTPLVAETLRVKSQTPVWYGPDRVTKVMGSLDAGTVVESLAHTEAWWRVPMPDGRAGWIPATAIEVVVRPQPNQAKESSHGQEPARAEKPAQAKETAQSQEPAEGLETAQQEEAAPGQKPAEEEPGQQEEAAQGEEPAAGEEPAQKEEAAQGQEPAEEEPAQKEEAAQG